MGNGKPETVQDWLTRSSTNSVDVVPISRLMPGFSPRTDRSRSAAHIKLLAECDYALPPIIVHRPTMRVIDGEHRLMAAMARGLDTIGVRFFDGSDEDAFALAVHANVIHGLALLTEERKTAARLLLRTHPHWSDRLIARTAGLSHKTVGTLRRADGDASQLHDERVGIDGRTRRVGMEGRRTAEQLILQTPDASLREIARSAGISTRTARDVRNRVIGRGRAQIPRDFGESGQHKQTAHRKTRNSTATAAASNSDARKALLSKLSNDPTLRFTQQGREVLRRLSSSSRDIDFLEKLIDDGPRHWRSVVARIAHANASAWGELAIKLDSCD